MTGVDALASGAWLADHLGNPAVKPVDATWYLRPTVREARAEYDQCHIPGAVYFDIDKIADQTSGLPHTLPRPEQFAAAVGALGIGNGDHVVVYDAQGIYSAPRVWWMFRVFGHDRVRVLDGGLPAWRRDGRPLTAEPTVIGPTTFTANLKSPLLSGLQDVRQAVAKNETHIVDARPAGRFNGTQPEPRPGVRSGHMPGATNLPYADVLNETGDGFLPQGELIRRFQAAGIRRDTGAITTCGSGVTACILSLGLYLIGHERWSVYDGSWSEWGSRDDTPVEGAPG